METDACDVVNLPALKNADVKNKTVLLRADFDLPLAKQQGKLVVADDLRLLRALPTIEYLLAQNCKLVIIAHLGRPKSRDLAKSLLPVAERLAEILKYKLLELDQHNSRLPHYQLPHVFFYHDDFRDSDFKPILAALNPKDVLVLENLRFYPGEDAGALEFARELAELAQVFVNDAFGSSYDERASLALVPRFLPHFAGFELEHELNALSPMLLKPSRPYVTLIGGAKLSEKLGGLEGILERADSALVGGGLASLFFQSLGYEVGKSVISEKSKFHAAELLRNFRSKLNLPLDVVVAPGVDRPEALRVCKPDEILPSEMILDIGPETVKKFSAILRQAKTIVWAGPMGKFEVREFSHGTKALGMLLAARSGGPSYVVAGGGDTLEAIKLIKMDECFDFLSTGGSSLLLHLGGVKLPGVEALGKI